MKWLRVTFTYFLMLQSTQAFVQNKFDSFVSINIRSSTQLKAWGVSDDWSTLSNAEDDYEFDPMDPNSYYDKETNVPILSEEDAIHKKKMDESPEDQYLLDAMDTIHSSNGIVFDSEPPVPPLYDTAKSFEAYTKTVSFIDEAGFEISMLVRCNETPDALLIKEGRALEPLTDIKRFDLSQLITPIEPSSSYNNTATAMINPTKSPTEYKTTPFFDETVSKIFHLYAQPKKISPTLERAVLDSGGVSTWMSVCLGESVGKHDKRITAVISRYGTYGTGYLESYQFHQLYLDAVLAGVAAQQRKNHLNKRKIHFKGVVKFDQPDLSSVWRDFKAHGILTPVEEEYRKKEEEIEARIGHKQDDSKNAQNANMLIDECEILDWGGESETYQKSKSRKKKKVGSSSHENIDLASDGKTPSRLRDGSFVFIDEESCIGCTQCAQTAPSSFKMLENGRARTFSQSNNPEVDVAVSVCPVDCMHKVGFDELTEMEKARDGGDGRTDHRHMGRGQVHTPLYVAGIGSDNNHKSSWYHYLKSKCYTSKSCPKKGCYDCPMYSEKGGNPYFKMKHRKAEQIRAKDLIDSGEADKFRNYFEL